VGGEDDVLVTGQFRRLYGSTPLHVIAHVVLFVLFAYVALQLFDARAIGNILAWFVAALILHDFVVLPLYAGADRLGQRIARGAINYVRVPAGLSLLLLLLFYPPILGRNDGSFSRVAGVEPDGYLERWLLVTAALFVVAAALYAVRLRRTPA
jgi:fumarate reductase subunit D